MMKKSASSRRWLKAHHKDPYVKEAKATGLRSRAAFKLKQIQEKYQLVKKGMYVVDLGAAPGGWSELLVQWVGAKGRLVAMDLLPMTPINGVEFIQGDFSEQDAHQSLCTQLKGRKLDGVYSDMAPNLSGIKAVDQDRSMALCELALDFAKNTLLTNGHFVIKVFQGAGFDAFLKEVRAAFKKVAIYKPDASRARSREVYIVAIGFKEDGYDSSQTH